VERTLGNRRDSRKGSRDWPLEERLRRTPQVSRRGRGEEQEEQEERRVVGLFERSTCGWREIALQRKRGPSLAPGG
jgi:hypothetical protein